MSDLPVILLDERGDLPVVPNGTDICLTRAMDPPAPWVSCRDVRSAARSIEAAFSANPVSAATLLQVLRLTEQLQSFDALAVESFAYSTLLGGAEFRRWLAKRPSISPAIEPEDPVRFERADNHVTLTLDSPATLNAYSRSMRDALAAALDSCLIDPTDPFVTLCGAGRAFSTGGALEEFGLANDLAEAHQIRLAQSTVVRLLALGHRASVEIDGAAIGSGVEIAAAVPRVTATSRSWFRLPEVAMGLIPGAGGTVTISRRVGRHRACWMMLTGQRINAKVACSWGLINAVSR